jgi:hypothetical protein
MGKLFGVAVGKPQLFEPAGLVLGYPDYNSAHAGFSFSGELRVGYVGSKPKEYYEKKCTNH